MTTFKNEVAFIAANVADLEQLIAGLRSEVQPVVLAAEESAPLHDRLSGDDSANLIDGGAGRIPSTVV